MIRHGLCFVCFCIVQLYLVSSVWSQELQVNWAPEFSPDRPGEVQVEGPIPLGDGRYRVSFSAAQPSVYDMAVHYEVVDGLSVNPALDELSPVTAELQLVGHPNFPQSIVQTGFSGLIGPVTVSAATELDLELFVYQSNGAAVTAQYNGDREYTVPSGPHPISFFADVGADGHYELSGGAAEFEFESIPAENVQLVGYATAGGLSECTGHHPYPLGVL